MIDINERLGTVRDITLLNLTERQSREEPRPVTSSIVDDSEIYGRVDDIYCIMLKLNECYSLRKLPEGIWKLPNLRHLELKETFALNYFPRGLERLRCLRTLSRVKFNGGKGCQIGELKLLDHIQGELRIEGLGQVADPIEAVLQKKEKLRSLDLRFSEERHDDARREESVLNGLQPHTNLAKLYILFYQGNKFPSWMSNNIALPNLVKLELRNCTQCSELPALGRLQNLEHLELWKLGSVKRIGCEFYGLGSTDGTSTGGEDSVVVFPKLHTLKIYNMEECEESHMPFRRGVEVFPKLRKLIVINLMKLQMLPPGLGKLKSLEELILQRVGLVLFGLISRNTDDDNVTLISAQEEEGFIMPCLQVLEISDCPNLKVVPHYLFSPALRSLEISSCPQLTGRQPCLPHLLEELILRKDTEKEKAGPPIPTFQRSNLITKTSSQNNRLISKPVTCSPANLTLNPLGDKVLVKIKSTEEKTVGGILLPSTARSKPQGGELVAVGEGKTLGKDKLEITIGAQIVYSKYAGTELEFYGSTHLLLKEDDIVGILETDEVNDLKPINDRVLIKVAEAEQKTAGGLCLTEASNDKPSIETVSGL
ncbi:hypothetical protein IFM89_020738 [Coptis chinensis]|uniref:20 kDa chaperonin, chloroplastic n=1 Tax=Coptis chinensis TaxID=261450 RepID=A0A835M0V9_9MAGN|nr:hypothetical protein IFM89_020738 [Coptis chinensis]